VNISEFRRPESVPIGLLEGYRHAFEKETVLAIILGKCIEAGGFVAVETKHDHPKMVEDGLLEKVGDREYKLTKKAIGLLYGEYGIVPEDTADRGGP